MLTESCHGVVKRFQMSDSQEFQGVSRLKKYFICLPYGLQMGVDTILQIQANIYEHTQIHIKVYFPNKSVLPMNF